MKEGANACKTLFVEGFPGSAERCSQQVSMNAKERQQQFRYSPSVRMQVECCHRLTSAQHIT